MANVASVIKEEILRLARKEVRLETEKLRKASAHYRTEISALKRRVESLEKQVSKVEGKSTRESSTSGPNQTSTGIRFSAKRLASQREKLGLTAAQMAMLVGVSAQTSYNWEAEKSRPRQTQLVAIASVRRLGKKQVKALLASQISNEGTSN